jgi:hypothetical protein
MAWATHRQVPSGAQRPMDPGTARFGVKCGGEEIYNTLFSRPRTSINGMPVINARMGD